MQTTCAFSSTVYVLECASTSDLAMVHALTKHRASPSLWRSRSRVTQLSSSFFLHHSTNNATTRPKRTVHFVGLYLCLHETVI